MTLAYRTWGTGRHAVIMLHGWLGDESTFDRLPPTLPLDRLTLVAPALRGYGASIDRTGRFTVDEAADDVLALADELNLTRFSLVGHSMGGKIALRMLAQAPDRVLGIAGVTPVSASGLEFDERTWAVFRRAAHDAAARRRIIHAGTGYRLPDERVAAMEARIAAHADPEALAAYLESWAGEDFSTLIPKVRLPIHVYVGEHDSAITAELMRRTYLNTFPDMALEILGDAGHYPAEEAPGALAAGLGAFLTSYDQTMRES